jgi:hypothetical protein
MTRVLKAAAVLSGVLVVGIYFRVTANSSHAYADVPLAGAPPAARSQAKEPPPAPPDPKKKMPGDACTSSDECQNHHTCTKVGDKSVCQAPSRSQLPPGAVT